MLYDQFLNKLHKLDIGYGTFSNVSTGIPIKRSGTPSAGKFYVSNMRTNKIVGGGISDNSGNWSISNLNLDEKYRVIAVDENQVLNAGILDRISPEDATPSESLNSFTIDQIYPSFGWSGEDNYIVIVGDGIEENASVLFGLENPSPDVIQKTQRVAHAKIPASGSGTVDVNITSQGQTITITDGLEFLEYEFLPIVNGDAESGDMTGWTIIDPGVYAATSPAFTNQTETPYEGSYIFYGGDSDAFSKVSQEVQIPSSFDSYIDASNARLDLSWYQGSYDGSDEAEVSYEFLDSVGNSIGGEVSNGLFATQEGWHKRSYEIPIPSGARSVIFYMIYNRTSGSNNNGYIDKIEAVVRQTNS